MGKMLSNSIARYREIVRKRINVAHFIADLCSEIATATPTCSNHPDQPSTLRQDPPPAKDYNSLKAKIVVSIFLTRRYF